MVNLTDDGEKVFIEALACGLPACDATWLAGWKKGRGYSRIKSRKTALLVEFAKKQPGLSLLGQLYRSRIVERDRERQAASEERRRRWLEVRAAATNF
jgi:hypothetical protein